MHPYSSKLRSFRLLWLLVISFTSVILVNAQSDQSNGDKSNGKVDALFVQWSKPDSPGCALGVVEQGQLIYQRGYGSANLDFTIPNSAKTVFNIASVSKQFTAMSIALLARQGKLHSMTTFVSTCRSSRNIKVRSRLGISFIRLAVSVNTPT